jgi:hypothetical protein
MRAIDSDEPCEHGERELHKVHTTLRGHSTGWWCPGKPLVSGERGRWGEQIVGEGVQPAIGICTDIDGDSWHTEGTSCVRCGFGIVPLTVVLADNAARRAVSTK